MLILAGNNTLNVQMRVAGNVFFVSKNGSDGNNGDQLHPWNTIQYAVNKWVPGSIVWVEPGIYNEAVAIMGDNSCQLLGQPGAIIDGSGINLSSFPKTLIHIYISDNIIIDGFELRNAQKDTEGTGLGTAIYIFNENKVHGGYTFRNLNIHHCFGAGMLFVQGYPFPTTLMKNILVDNCTLHDLDTGPDFNTQYSNPAIHALSVDGLEITNTLIYNIGMQYATWTGQEGMSIIMGSKNVLVHHNEVYNCNSGLYFQSQDLPMSNIKAYCNRFHHNYANGITLGAEGTNPQSMTNLDIFNNLIYLNATILGHQGTSALLYGNGGIDIKNYNFQKNYRFRYNTLYKNGGKSEIYIVPANQQNCQIDSNIIVGKGNSNLLMAMNGIEGLTINKNLYWNADHPSGLYIPDVSAPIQAGSNYKYADPRLVNPDNGDFSLRADSPAIDMGLSVDAPKDDFNGVARPYGIGFDAGAYEYAG